MKTIRAIEERCLNAWPPLQEMLYDGWLLRFANGYTRRANSVQPIYPGQAGVYEKVLACEKLYREKQLAPVFKMTPLVNPEDLDGLLEGRGYGKEATTSVQSCTLKGLARVNGVAVDEAPDEHWMEAYTRLQAMQEQDARSFRSILERVASRMCFASVVESGEVMAAGMAVREGGYVGLFGLVTDAQKRNQGFGKRLVSGLLTHAKEGGAQMAYLQVLVTNDPALSLYAKLGFEEVYRYWYRVKNN